MNLEDVRIDQHVRIVSSDHGTAEENVGLEGSVVTIEKGGYIGDKHTGSKVDLVVAGEDYLRWACVEDVVLA